MKAVLFLLIALGAADARPFGYEKGKRYTHQYECEVTQAIPGGSSQSLGLRAKCQAHLDAVNQDEYLISLEDCQLTERTESEKDPTQNTEKALRQDISAAMQQKLHLPVKAVFKDDQIKEIQAEEDDDEWSQNIKRGLVNLLQIAVNADQLTGDEKQFITRQETTAVGKCEVAYVVSSDKQEQSEAKQPERVVARVTKVINYEKCKTRPEFKQSIYYPQKCTTCEKSALYAPYHRSTANIEHLLVGSAKAGFTIEKTVAVEEHIVTPYADRGGHVTVRSRQCLQFTACGVMQPITKPLSKKLGQMFVAENPALRWIANSVYQNHLVTEGSALIDQMAEQVKQLQTSEAAETVACLVQKLQHCNKETWKKMAAKMLAQTDPIVRKLCLDAWSYVGTIDAFEALQENVQQKDKCEPDVGRLFLGLPFTPYPSTKHLKISWKLCQHDCVNKDFEALRHCMLAFGAMAHRILQQESAQQDTKTITVLQDYIQEILHQLASKTATDKQKAMYVKTLGNAGHPQALEDITRILKNRNQSLHLRVDCVEALRRIIPQAREKIHASLIRIFADATESPELRMVISLIVLETEPHFFTMQALANIVRQELSGQKPGQTPGPQSNQVASFVIAKLWALAYQNTIITKRRSMDARMVLRLLPRTSFFIGYSKGGYLSGFVEKLQTGFELQANVMRVPQNIIGRNVMAKLEVHMFGHRMNALEVCSRNENLRNVLDDILSEIHSRHKRSLIGSLMSWFNNDQQKGAPGPPRPTRPEPVKGSKGAPGDALAQDPNDKPKKPEARRTSFYVKLFGDELGYWELRNEDFDQLTKDVVELLLGKKKSVEYAYKGVSMVISKNGVEFHTKMEKALFTAHARQMIPTLCGIPLDLCLQSTVVAKMDVDAVVNAEGLLLNPFNIKKVMVAPHIKLSVGAFASAQVGVHTPFYQFGLRAKRTVHADPGDKITFNMEFGREYNATYNIPQNERDIIRFDSDARGFTCEMNPKTFSEDRKEIPIQLHTPHLVKVDRRCGGENLFGVQVCAEGQVPNLAALMLPRVPVFPTVEMTKWQVTMAPAADRPTMIQYTSQVTQNEASAVHSTGDLTASSATVTRKIPVKLTYSWAGQGRQEKLEIECSKIQAPQCTNCMAKVTAQPVDMKHWEAEVEFGQEGAQNHATLEGRLENAGKHCYLEARWTKIPDEWKTFCHKREMQFMHLLQQFSLVSRSEAKKERIAFDFKMTSTGTADICLKTPNFDAERTNMPLPLRIDCFPSSFAEIKNAFYGKCVVQQNRIKMFDQLVIEHDLSGKCGYVLAQDHRRQKQPRIRIILMVNEKGQKTLVVLIQSPAAERIEIGSGLTIAFDGQTKECEKEACKDKNGAVTVRKVQSQGAGTRIHLSTMIGLYASVDSQQIELYSSPLLRNRVRGLCGDRNGELYREFKDPEEHVLRTQTKFIESWKHKC